MTPRRPALPLRLLLLVLLALPGVGLAERRSVELKTDDGVLLRGTFYTYRGTGPGVLFFSQCTGSHTAFQTLAAKISSAGLRVLSFDYRGPGPQRAGDLDAAYRYLTLQPGVDSPSVGIFGVGCGATEALLFAARHPDQVRSLALLSAEEDERVAKVADALSKVPLLAIASAGDGKTAALTHWLFDRSQMPVSRLVLYKGDAHGAALYRQDQALLEEISGWFTATLLPAGALREP